MQYTVDMRKIFNMRPDLDYSSVGKLSMDELLQLQQKYDEIQIKNNCSDDDKDKYRKVYLLFDELNRYIPEEIIFEALGYISKTNVWSERTVDSLKDFLNYYLLDKYEEGGKEFFNILVPCYSQGAKCNETVFRQIIYYYYPLLRNFSFSFSREITSIFDYFYFKFEDDEGFSNKISITLLDIIFADIDAIINQNTIGIKNLDENNKETYKKSYNRRYGSKEFQFFAKILTDERNPKAVCFLPKEGNNNE